MDPLTIGLIVAGIAGLIAILKKQNPTTAPTSTTVPTSTTTGPTVPTPAPTPTPVTPVPPPPPIPVIVGPPIQSSAPGISGSVLPAGGVLNGILKSPSTAYQLAYASDGALRLFGPGGVAWDTGTAGQSQGFVTMQGDGNFVVYNAAGAPVWNSGTFVAGSYLVVQDGGALAIVAPGGAVVSTITGSYVTPSGGGGGTNPLPPAPDRGTLSACNVRLQGVTVSTQQLGTVPSWGPEIGMLNDLADRQAVYAAHRAAGASHLALAIFIHYVESGVAYEGGNAATNDFTNNIPALYSLLNEIITVGGLWPVLFLGGDELTPNGVSQAVGGWVSQLRNDPRGDITRHVVFCGGFDSICDGIFAGNWPASDVDNMIVAIRNAIGDGVQAFEIAPPGKPFWSGGVTGKGGVDCYLSPAGQAIDAILFIFDNDGPPAAPPKMTGCSWDSEHNDYVPIYASSADSWNNLWECLGRALPSYNAGAIGQPFGVPLLAIDGPQKGQVVSVNTDSQSPPKYTANGTPRGPYTFVGFEYRTYAWTHGSCSPGDVAAMRSFLFKAGFGIVA